MLQLLFAVHMFSSVAIRWRRIQRGVGGCGQIRGALFHIIHFLIGVRRRGPRRPHQVVQLLLMLLARFISIGGITMQPPGERQTNAVTRAIHVPVEFVAVHFLRDRTHEIYYRPR